MSQLQQQLPVDPSVSDRRTQVRIDVQIPVRVKFPGHDEPITAINQDISWGGALLLISEPLPTHAGPLKLTLPWKRDEQITAHAQLLRARPLQGGQYLIAVRFISLSPRSQSRLERLLKMLSASDESIEVGDTSGLVRELEVTVSDADELRHMLRQIAKGRHTVTVFDAYEPNQSISLSITGTRDLPGIRLRARVVEVRESKATGFDWTNLHTLVLEFEHPKKAIRSFAKMLIDQLPEPGDRSGREGELPDWIRSVPLAKPSRADAARRAGASGIPSALERDFPEALTRLIAGWGDPEAFEIMFRDLVLGDQGQPGGWPTEAWVELELLQNVHDCAYGMSGNRKALLKGGRAI
ncbi:PilZ domain-containing protein [Thiorhodococcus minor]|uniref:PilZ domain-containing protein n=1 Tax=Thiorhodococcus minor TaxID=57489 RepID=A0A6M0JV60_9GAMM|nr:PilZ domain-containing protein [Thiorhodococcus minor]NEV61059.1 PilZ domain-containing protein [Thiorhodococcus minor]